MYYICNMTARHLPLLLNGLTAAALAAAALVAGLTYDAPLAGFAPVDGVAAWQYEQIAASKPANVPTFASHGQPGCAPLVEGELVDVVLVVTQDGETVRMGFDAAWDRSHDDTWANDVWTIGQCR